MLEDAVCTRDPLLDQWTGVTGPAGACPTMSTNGRAVQRSTKLTFSVARHISRRSTSPPIDDQFFRPTVPVRVKVSATPLKDLLMPSPLESPLLRMWRDRLEQETAREDARAARRAVREAEHASWHEAWRSYKARRAAAANPSPLPRWWNLPGWVLWLVRLHSPGRPN